ncbi:SGNH/GDSL hydrolase family protein [Azohydromonas aeria]|uniref:SGNH/GDSL hydrolase family protein n=1 Tax=Azohydromonas aeria TaxID=2590212 RepID=UPI0012F88347|nr:SGNH/GDSL hydrolase family protein [Azohydromonas aeria]
MRHAPARRRLLGAALVASLLAPARVVAAQPGAAPDAVPPPGWMATWSAAPQPPSSWFEAAFPRFENQTLRQVVHVSQGGSRLRVRLSNAYGTAPLVIGEAQVARQAVGPDNVPGSNRPLTFQGQAGITLAPGTTAVSDPVRLQVPAQGNLSVSLYLPQFTASVTRHLGSLQTNFVSTPGNFAAAASVPGVFSNLCNGGASFRNCSSPWLFIVGVDVESPRPAAVVALGDSITNGASSSVNRNRRWTDVLARRLVVAGQAVAVLNQGIGGNTLVAPGRGPTVPQRFERDVLRQPGVRYVLLLIGINDIRRGVPAEVLIDACRALIVQAHARGLKVYGATLLPFGSPSDAMEAQRLAFNRWLRNAAEFDAVVDFDAAVRGPARPRRLRPDHDSGDGLHPSDAGHEALGRAIDLSLFSR